MTLCARQDDAFSSVPYEKGFNFLWYLEQLVGGPAVMDPFLKAHCKRFEVTSLPIAVGFLIFCTILSSLAPLLAKSGSNFSCIT